MKKIILFILIAAVSFSLSAYTFDASVQKDLCELQKQAFMLEYGTQVNDLINQFEQRSNIEQLPEQEALTVKANVLIVKMNNVSDKNELKHLITDMKYLHEQMDEIYHKKNDLSEQYLTALGDIKSRIVNYISGGEMYKISMEAKKLYQQAIKINNKYAPAYTGYANWFYFAPAVAGGGYKEALKQFSKAVSYSTNQGDLYINLIYRSQVYLKLGNKKECQKDLQSAHDIFPNETLTAVIRGKNEKGLFFLD